jgi:hypothetical protein
MLSVIMLSVIMLSVIMLSVIMLSVIMLSVIVLNVIMLSVTMLSVVAPYSLSTATAHLKPFFLQCRKRIGKKIGPRSNVDICKKIVLVGNTAFGSNTEKDKSLGPNVIKLFESVIHECS